MIKDRETLNELRREIRTNLIGNGKFYKFNQLFFELGLLGKIIESVTFNSLSCVPGLIMILILGAMYELRKKFSKSYRTYSFNVVYFIQYMMIVKISGEMFMNIPNINASLVHGLKRGVNNDRHWLPSVIQVIFGKLHNLEENEDEEMFIYTIT